MVEVVEITLSAQDQPTTGPSGDIPSEDVEAYLANMVI